GGCRAHPSSSSTASGSTPTPGDHGCSASTTPATERALRDGPATRARAPRREAPPTARRGKGPAGGAPPPPRGSPRPPRRPVVIGHSFGGLIAQRLLGQGLAAAAVGIDAAPIKGVRFLPRSALRVASVALRNPANRKRAVSLTREQFRYGFGNAIPAAESDE